MGKYCGSWKIDDILYHKIQTSSVTTGAATDADAAPTWGMYEDSTATPVTTGSYSTLNSQTGFYTAAMTLAAAIGYEKGKTYSIRYQATVGGVIGADVDMFQIEAEVDSNTISGSAPAGFLTAGSFSGNALAGMAVTVGATAAGAIADAVWDEPKAGHTTADTYGEYLDATVSGIAAGDTTVSATAAAAIADAVWAETAANYTTAGSMGFVLQDAQSLNAIVNAVWGATRAAHATAGTFGEGMASVQGNVTGSVASVTGAVTVGSTSRAAIVDEVWDEPKAGHTTADTYGEYLDTTLASVKAKTDLIFAGTGNSIAADIRYVNGVSVTGNGQSGTEWGPGS